MPPEFCQYPNDEGISSRLQEELETINQFQELVYKAQESALLADYYSSDAARRSPETQSGIIKRLARFMIGAPSADSSLYNHLLANRYKRRAIRLYQSASEKYVVAQALETINKGEENDQGS